MDARLVELYVERGRLRERIGMHRAELASELQPLGEFMHKADRARMRLHQIGAWMAANPGIVATVAVAVVVWRPRSVLNTARKGLYLWRNWGRWRNWLRIGLRVL